MINPVRERKCNTAYRFDEWTAIDALSYLVENANTTRSMKLGFLYGGRAAMIHGGIPDAALSELDALITYYERNIDVATGDVRKEMEPK